MTASTAIKDPDADALISVDFAPVIGVSGVISAHLVTTTVGSVATSQVDGTTVLARLAGGTLGQSGEMQFRATRADSGLSEVQTVRVQIARVHARPIRS